MSIFVIWDTKIQNLTGDLKALAIDPALAAAPLTVLGFETSQGYVLEHIEAALAGARGAIAVLDTHNANVGFEMGLALGAGVPLALVARTEAAKGWFSGPPFAGHLIPGGSVDPDALAAEIARLDARDRTAWNVVAGDPAPGDDVLLLWPENTRGKIMRSALPTTPPRRLPPLAENWPARELPARLSGVRKVVWVVLQPNPGERDGSENARLSVVAGYAKAKGIELVVLIEDPPEGGRTLTDVHGIHTRFTDVHDLKRLLEKHLAAAPAASDPADPLAPWFTYLRERHDHLIPFCDHLPSATLRLVHVPLQLAAAHHRGDHSPDAHHRHDDRALDDDPIGGDHNSPDASHHPDDPALDDDQNGSDRSADAHHASADAERAVDPHDRAVNAPRQRASATRAFTHTARTLDAPHHPATRAFTHTDRTLEALLRAAQTPLRLIVAADPGGGKTTTARHLVHTLAAAHADDPASTEPIPVYLSLAAWSAGLDPFAEVERADQVEFANGQPGLAARLRNERRPVWLLLDGLDEVGGGRRTQLVAAIEAFAKANPAVAVVVLSRQEGLRGHFEAKSSTPWLRAALEGLSLTQRKELLTRLVPDNAHRAEITRQIDALPRLAEIAKNPLMLTLTAVVGRDALAQGGRVPTSRPALYEQAVSVLLHGKHRDPPRRVRDPGTAADALGVIAYVLHQKDGESWDETTANRAIRDAWDVDDKVFRDVARFWGSADRGDGTPQDLADDLRDNAGLFGTFDGDGRWRFRHRTLKEYLVARTVDRLGKASEFLRTWEAEPKSKDTGGRRSDEIVALLTAIRPGDTSHLPAMAQRAPDALVRLLTTTEGLDPNVVLDLLLSIQNQAAWDEDQLVTALLSANGAVTDLCDALWRRVKPGCDPRTCCMLYGALARIPAGGDLRATLTIPTFRARFFNQLGIPLPDPAKLRVERVPRGTPHQPPARGPVVIRVVELDAGTFRMGSPVGVGEDREHPAHDVTVGPFALGQTLVTRAAWAVFEAARTTGAGANQATQSSPSASDPQFPVVGGTWWDAALFAAWLGARLPTEAEWEYACRAGTTTKWSHGDDEAGLKQYAHFESGEGQPVATKRPNPWGLYDVHGNTEEWCADDQRTYLDTAADAPIGPRGGARVVRGGSILVSADGCRSAYRFWSWPWGVWSSQGVRVLFPPPARDP